MGILMDRRSDITRQPHDPIGSIATGIVKATVTKGDQAAVQQKKSNGKDKLDKQMSQNFNYDHGDASLLFSDPLIIQETSPRVNYILNLGLPNTQRKLTESDTIADTAPITIRVVQSSTGATALTVKISPTDNAHAARQRRTGK